MIVVDSNVIAYLLIPSSYTNAAEALRISDPHWAAPVLWRSELRNILRNYLAAQKMSLDSALALQAQAERLMSGNEHNVESAKVLTLAAQSGCTAYDCEFIALAQHLGVKLVTVDKQLLKAFPQVAQSLLTNGQTNL